MKNREVEIKVKISKDKYQQLKKFLSESAIYISSNKQEDKYYSPANKAYIQKDGAIYKWLRLRLQEGKSILTYKFVYKGKNNKGRGKDEFETVIDDYEQMDSLLHAIGFEELVSFEKHRDTYIYANDFEVALDHVPGLGYFVEIEIKKACKNEEEEIEKIADELEIDIKDESLLGYAHLMMIQKGITSVPDFIKNTNNY